MTELDAWEISQLLARYGHIVDNFEWPELAGVFTADAVLECRDEQVTGLDAITRHLREQSDRSAHHTVNTQLDEDTHGVRARSRIVVIGYDAAVHSSDVVDTIVRTADGWRISRRQDRRRTRSARSASNPRSSSDARPRSDPVPSQNRMEPVAARDGYPILDVLARYAHVIDNADWERLGTVFTPDVTFRGSRSAVRGWAGIADMIGAVRPYHPHHTTDVLLGARGDGTVRAWSKYFIVRDDGTAGSGDYLDTLVKTHDGWRVHDRRISRGHRAPNDPGGTSERTFAFGLWQS
jgi:3-phenylpropionate/cinnamic acid dioxygenase small subunit